MIWCPNWRPRALNSRWRCKSATQSTLPRVCHPLASSRFPLASSRVRCVSRGSRRGCPRSSARFAPTCSTPLTTRARSSRACPSSSPCTTRRSSPTRRRTRVRSKSSSRSRSAARSVGPLRSSCLPRRRAMRRSSTRAVTPRSSTSPTTAWTDQSSTPWMTLSVRVSRSPSAWMARSTSVSSALSNPARTSRTWYAVGRRRFRTCPILPHWFWPAARAGMRTLTRPWRQSPRT